MLFKIKIWKLFFSIKLKKKILSCSIGILPTYPVEEAFTSTCGNFQHVLFLDYDKVSRQLVETELPLLQEYFNLPPFYLFASYENKDDDGLVYGNYHAISLAKMSFNEVIEIQDKASIDYAYRRMYNRTKFKSWVLRSTSKGKRNPPKFLKIIGPDNNLDAKISGIKLLELHRQYEDLPVIKYLNYDKDDWKKEISYLTEYKTRNRVKDGKH